MFKKIWTTPLNVIFLRGIMHVVLYPCPRPIKRWIASNGGAHILPRGLDYIAPCFNTQFKFHGNTSYSVATEASSGYTGSFASKLVGAITKKGDCFFDVGANIGTMTLLATHYNEGGRVVSFEPGPLFSTLENNVRINNLHNIQLLQLGLGRQEGELLWAEDLNNKGNAHLLDSGKQYDFSQSSIRIGRELERVSVKTLDSMVEEFDACDIFKMDVEGMEGEVIDGGKLFFKKFLPSVIMETSLQLVDVRGEDYLSEIFAFFATLGYQPVKWSDGELKRVIYPNLPMDTLFVSPRHRERVHIS